METVNEVTPMYRLNKYINRENGSVMVEFALVSIILILLLAGIIQFGLVFNTQLSLENAVANSARYISMPIARTDSEIKTYITSLVPSIPLDTSKITISPSVRQRGEAFTVTINYEYPIPVNLGVLPEKFALRVSSVAMQQ
jgi:Flp pilus assembly protein TadG